MSRPLCPRCNRPLVTCICMHLVSIANQIKVVVLQHPIESKNAKNTGFLLPLMLMKCELMIGESFSNQLSYQKIVSAPASYLLFPRETENTIHLDDDPAQLPKVETLIILDGTWRKARKLYYNNSELHSLPGLYIHPQRRSNYRIRKVSSKEDLATVEAVAECLGWLEKNSDRYSPLHYAFGKMIDRQIEIMGEEVYNRNYT